MPKPTDPPAGDDDKKGGGNSGGNNGGGDAGGGGGNQGNQGGGADKPKKREQPTKTKIQGYLKAHGHKSEDMDKAKLDTDAEIGEALRKAHGVKLADYRAAGGRL